MAYRHQTFKELASRLSVCVSSGFSTEPEFVNFKGAQESIPPGNIAWREGTTAWFLALINCFTIPEQYFLFTREELRLEAEKEQKKKGKTYSHFFYTPLF